jgi:pimeloyl-ACP methyl ester carboxylesterase
VIIAHGHAVACRTVGASAEVVLVHGIGVSGRYFTRLARELGRSVGVLVLDLPGFGGSPRPAAPLSIAEHGRVVADVIARTAADRPVLVGHSMGAQVVAEAALARPEAVAGVVLVGPVVDPKARSGVRQAARLIRDVPYETPAATAMQVREWLRCGPRWYAATLPKMLDYPMASRVGDLRVPVVLARGEHDPVTPARFLGLLADRIPNVRTLEVPGAGHVAMFRRPEYVASAVLELRR